MFCGIPYEYPYHRQNNTIRSAAAAGGVRSTNGVVLPLQTETAPLGFGLVIWPWGVPFDRYPSPRQNNTIRSAAAAGGVRSTDGVVLPLQTETASLGFGLAIWPRSSVRSLPFRHRRRGLHIVRSDVFYKTPLLIHSVAPPLKTRPAAPGCRFVFYRGNSNFVMKQTRERGIWWVQLMISTCCAIWFWTVSICERKAPTV